MIDLLSLSQMIITMKKTVNFIHSTLIITGLVLCCSLLSAQPADEKRQILIDIAHGQKFWNDPTNMPGADPKVVERVKYMTQQITTTAESVNADVGYLKGKIKPADLSNCDLIFIHLPSAKYDAEEVKTIQDYLRKGGNLFFVMDADYWSTLEQVNANEILSISDLKFGATTSDTISGGYTKPTPLTNKKFKVTYHGGRSVAGGTPFCYNNQTDAYSFGSFSKLKKGGKIVAMGDGMVSLYMTSWKDVTDYQCQEFMQEVFGWLLK